MWYVDITPDGSYISAAGKHVHANQMGSGADVYLADCTTQGVEGGIAGSVLGLAISPNPCPGASTLGFTLPEAGSVNISIYDLTGRRVQQVTSGSLSQGQHSIPVSTGLPSGLYIVSMEFQGIRTAEKLLISR